MTSTARNSRPIEHDVEMLRGMQVDPAFRRQGVGTRLLRALVADVERQECFCIPFEHLAAFYGQAGFEEIPEAGASRFLVDRLAKYRAVGHKVIVMRRPPFDQVSRQVRSAPVNISPPA